MQSHSDLAHKGRGVSHQQSDFTATVNFLYATVSLTNCILRGPIVSEEERWMVQVTDHWIQIMIAFKEVFRIRRAASAAQDYLFEGFFSTIRLFKRDQAMKTSECVGKLIRLFAGRLKDHLQTQHSWHDAYINECVCCRCHMLQTLQQSTIQQFRLLEGVVIPWQN